MKIKALALVSYALLCVGLSSCKDDGRQDLPKVPTHVVNPEDTGSSAKYTGPMTKLQVSMTATYPATSKSRAFNTSFKKGTSDNNLMQINWEKGKTYKLRVCIRPNTTNQGGQNGWNADDGPYAEFDGTVLSVSGETYTKDGKQYGTGGTLKIKGSINVPTTYLTAKNIYFAAFIMSEGSSGGTRGPILFQLPQMVAVHTPKNNTTNTMPNTIPTMNVLTAIPFTKVTFVKKESKYEMVKADENGNEDKVNKTYNIKPILTLFHFKVTNKLSHPIRFPEDQKLSFPKSSVAFGVGVAFDFWKFASQLSTIGTDNFFFHFGRIKTDNSFEHPVTTKSYSVGVDYSNVPDNLQPTYGGKKYIQLQPNDSLDFYVAGASVLDPTNAPSDPTPKFEIDFSSLGFQYQAKDGTWVDYRSEYSTLYAYSDAKDKDGNPLSDMSQYSKSLKEDIRPLYFSAKNAAADNYKQGNSYYKSFDVSSDLMIDLIGYRWDGVSGDNQGGNNAPTKFHGDNYSLVQLYNATSDSVDLSKYYLVRTLYNYGSHKILFCTNGWDFTTNLLFAVLCPIVSSGKTEREYSPMGYKLKQVMFATSRGTTDGTSKYHSFYKKLSGYTEFSTIPSKSMAIIGAQGFYKDTNFSTDKIHEQYSARNADYASKASVWSDVKYIGAIEDGRYDEEHYNPRDPESYPTNSNLDCYKRVPGNPWSSVMSRGNGSGQYQLSGDDATGAQTIGVQTLNGWALVKRIDVGDRHKFIIVDTFGPCPTGGNDDDSNCAQFLSGFGTNDASPLVFLRNPNRCQPYGAQMDVTNPKNDGPATDEKGWSKYVSWSIWNLPNIGYGPIQKPMIGVQNR